MNRGFLIGLCWVGALSCGASATDDEPSARREQSVTASSAPVGLSLFFSNGVAPAKLLLGDVQRFVQEIDLSEAVTSATDQGIAPLLSGSRVSGLNWNGVQQVEEIWVPAFDGTFTRERYFRGARWMEQSSTFRLSAVDEEGDSLGAPWVVQAGRDDRLRPNDDAFVRRFVARQSAFGCASVGDCTGSTRFVAEALVQLRDALDPEAEARSVPAATRELRLRWNRLPEQEYVVTVDPEPPSASDFDYGFHVEIEQASTPANGLFYVPGEAVSFRMVFRDGNGQRLNPPGALPSYADYVAGDVDSGLRYLDQSIQTRLYYALKHRESNLLFVLSGPTNRLRTPQTVVDPSLFFLPQVPFATRAVDGYTAVAQTVPPVGVVFGGLGDPSIWTLPVSDVVTFSVPADAESGTYVAAVKARRDFAGEALNRGATLEFQVGQTQPTQFVPQTQCGSCHNPEDRTDFATILHGIDDRQACFGCHSSLGIEFDNALDIRVHTIHDRSNRFEADIHDCALCHITPPTGPQRGVLP
jgi:predicted CXXCH cytochrome family protein